MLAGGAERTSSPTFCAAVLGATGAVGREVVLTLRDRAFEVVSVGRRAPGLGEDRHVALDDPTKVSAEHLAGVHAVFCCLGTTRGDAGSVENFRKVDRDAPIAAARAAKDAGVRFFGLVSSEGASVKTPRVLTCLGHVTHPLEYSRTKGEAEAGVSLAGVPQTVLYRPGLLDRGDFSRGGEKIAKCLRIPALPVSRLASVMVEDAEAACRLRRKSTNPPPPETTIRRDKEIRKRAGLF